MRIQRRKHKHIKGLDNVLDKLERAEDSMVQRAIEFVLYLLCAVHYDFINRIVTGQVEEMFQLTPNSICYLLDMKWEEAHHDKLFVLTGGYVKNIKILKYARDVDKAKTKKQIFTIGVTNDYKDVAIDLEQGFIYDEYNKEVPSRPLWEKYKKYLKWVVKMGDYGDMLEDSQWLTKFEEMQKDFAEIVKDDIKSRGKKIRFESIVQKGQTHIDSLITSEINNPKDFLTPSDLVDIAEEQQGNFTQKAWNRIRNKFKSAIIDGKMPTSVADKLGIKLPKKARK